MKTGTKEFYELMDQFEKDIINSRIYIGNNIKRTEKGTAPIGYFYDNGKINDLFTSYMLGYANAKQLYQA